MAGLACSLRPQAICSRLLSRAAEFINSERVIVQQTGPV
jgi:hypothetical protein